MAVTTLAVVAVHSTWPHCNSWLHERQREHEDNTILKTGQESDTYVALFKATSAYL